MKQKYLIASAAMALSAFLPVLAHGEEIKAEVRVNASTEKRVEMKQVLEEKRTELKDARENMKVELKDKRVELKTELKDMRASTSGAMKEKREEMKDKAGEVRAEFRSDIAKRSVEAVIKVLTATANRLGTLAERIDSRIAKIKAAGGVTVEAEASVSLAKADLVHAKEHIAAIGMIDLSGASTTAKANFEKVREEAKGAKEALTSARQNLEKAVASLKAIERTVKVKEQTTSTVNTQ